MIRLSTTTTTTSARSRTFFNTGRNICRSQFFVGLPHGPDTPPLNNKRTDSDWTFSTTFTLPTKPKRRERILNDVTGNSVIIHPEANRLLSLGCGCQEFYSSTRLPPPTNNDQPYCRQLLMSHVDSIYDTFEAF